MSRYNIEVAIDQKDIMEFLLSCHHLTIQSEGDPLDPVQMIELCDSIIAHIIKMIIATWHDLEDETTYSFKNDVISRLIQHPEIQKLSNSKRYLN